MSAARILVADDDETTCVLMQAALIKAGHVVELADPGDPDPAFYSLASGLGLHYWHLHAQAKMPANPHGAELTVDLPALREVLDQIG